MESQTYFAKNIESASTPTSKSRRFRKSDETSVDIQSMLGVGGNYSPIRNRYESTRSPRSNRQTEVNYSSGFVSMETVKAKLASSQPTSCPMKTSNRNLTLEQVVQKVANNKPLEFKSPARTSSSTSNLPECPLTRSRAFSVGSPSSGVRPDFMSLAPGQLANMSGRREGTPESDAGYGTSVQSTGSPDNNLADLVKAMTLKAFNQGEDISKRRSKLSSISEQDPAVTQAVKSNQSFINPGPNLLSTLLGYSPANLVASNLLSDQDQINSMFVTNPADPYSLERAAKLYRTAASLYEANCTWSGQLPTSTVSNPLYSNKVFLGGVPWDISEKCLAQSFSMFGPITIEWPGKAREGSCTPKGYLYIIFEMEGAVAALLEQCTHDFSAGGGWYYRVSSRRTRSKEVQVIPWVLGDSNFVRCSSPRLDPNKTVFVGALHGMLTAEGLAHIFNDLFGGVLYAGIDTDRHKYPIGSGRVTFTNTKSYMKAVSAAFIEIKTLKFVKKVQVDPYLEDALCSSCLLKQGPYFCRDLACFNYYCRYCWDLHHSSGLLQHHKPLMRNTRGGVVNRPIEPPGIYLPGINL